MPRTAVFDQHAARYDAWFERHPAVYASELAAVRALWPPVQEALEVGVGTGRFAVPLGIRHGVEPSPSMRRLAAARGVQVMDGVAEALPFPDRRFEAVLMVTTLCFVDDPLQAIREAYRVLRPGGFLVIGFMDRDSPPGRHYLERHRERPFYREARFLSASEVAALMQAAGLGELGWRQTLFSDPDTMTRPDPVREGHGTGAFVVVRGQRLSDPAFLPGVSLNASPEGWQSGLMHRS
ncbi:class I SAM-dependent methyltransferase [Rhodothermus marinus]|uniref:class I SAM-dependent methyltransferase n=1 Tax=Rhodothermus marinus TaxID=29549 RepID=UPI0037CB8726